MRRGHVAITFPVLALALLAGPTWGWYSGGHVRASRRAVQAAATQLPDFFATGAGTIAHCAVDPDVFKFDTGTGLLRDTESPQHFFELEHFDDVDLPETRLDFFFWCLRHHVSIHGIGTLPYALGESLDRLTVALAEYRRWPTDPNIQVKALVYAGHLAHYAQDLAQPLHTTVHYDGRATAAGGSPHTGIHARVDALIEKLPAVPGPAGDLLPYDTPLPDILDELRLCHAEVNRIYELAPLLPAADDPAPLDVEDPVGRFAQERLAAAARVTARLWLTAWTRSAQVRLPAWHSR